MNPSQELSAYHLRTNGASNDDAVIVQRIADRDETALALLYDHWVPQVYSMVVHLLRDADEAEDVVEETFWQVWQRAGAYDASRGTVRTWLLTIARSRALDRLRARNRHHDDVSLTDIAPLADSNPQLDAEETERRTRVLIALQELPDEQQQVLELAYFRGLSQSEIAELLSQPLGTVKTRMRLGMHKLRDKLLVLHDGTTGERT